MKNTEDFDNMFPLNKIQNNNKRGTSNGEYREVTDN
jgi:hypothetical protein